MSDEKTLQNLADNEDQRIRNSLFEFNHHNIMEAINEFIDMGKIPTVTEIASHARVSRQTVYNHLDSIPYFTKVDRLIELRRQRLIEMLYRHATNTSPFVDTTPASQLRAAELYLRYTEPQFRSGVSPVDVEIIT